MALRYNDATGEFEETGGQPEPPASDSLRYNPETGEFEPIRGRGSRRRSSGPRSSSGSTPRSGQTRQRSGSRLSRQDSGSGQTGQGTGSGQTSQSSGSGQSSYHVDSRQNRFRPRSGQAQIRPETEPRQWPTTEQFVASVRRAERQTQKKRQRILRRLCWIGLALAVVAFLLGGKEIAVTALGVVGLLWIAYGICAGAVWPWLVLGAIAAIYFLPTWLCIVIAIIIGIVLLP